MDFKEDAIIQKLKEFEMVEAFYEFMKRSDAFGRLCSGVMGFCWEEELIAYCNSNSLNIIDTSSQHLPYDYIINGNRVQAKCSSQEGNIDIRPSRPLVGNKENRRAYFSEDFDILAIKLLKSNNCYFVPSKYLEEFNQPYLIKYFDHRKYESFRNNWDILRDPNSFVVKDIFSEL